MKLSPSVTLFLTILTLGLLVTTTQTFAWDGFDPDNNTSIEIPPGNTVREGLVIEFYVDEELHLGRVNSMTSISGGTELIVEDFNDDDRERTLIMK